MNMKKHEIKIAPIPYEQVKAGTKTFEIRLNDRDYQKGDRVRMRWYDFGSYNDWKPDIYATIGDVYPIDAERVVFSIIKSEFDV